MHAYQPVRRHLTNFDSNRTGHVFADVLVVGGGVAGLSAAIAAADYGDVVVLTKGPAETSSTHLAQGGVAAAIDDADSVAEHVDDTLAVGAGLNRRAAVEFVCHEGVRRVAKLIDDGFPIDRAGARAALALEGGHGKPRILHAGGDVTGKTLSSFLTARARDLESIRLFRDCFLIDLITVDGCCVGAVTYHDKYGHQLIWATRTVLATGGYGQLFRETTNPPAITGDGVAAAYRAGARVCDMELVQFHPTTLYIAGSTRALISEAVRGEGAYLVDRAGERFMTAFHPDAELAPRDVLSRAIVDHLRATDGTCVYLDVRHIGRDVFARRFPSITSRCRDFGIDVGRDLIPVRPAAHFSIGGVVSDLNARTSLDGLLCCGESSCSGVHGANRLPSNSLLEGLVFGDVAGRGAGEDVARIGRGARRFQIRNENQRSPKTMLDLADVRQSLRSVMWRNAGIIRHGDRLAETVEIIDFWGRFVLDKTFNEPAGWEVSNMLILARLLASSAHKRRESRGVHFRSDAAAPLESFAMHYAFALEEGRTVESALDLDLSPPISDK